MKFDKKEKNKNELDLLFEEMVDTNKSNKIIPLKLQLRKSLESATLRNIMDLINGILTLLLSGFYLYSTYNPLNFKDGSMDWYNYISFLMHWYFLIEYTLKLYISQSFVNDLLSSNSFLDFITTVPYKIRF